MDLTRIGSAFVELETANWKLALEAWPRFDRRYYEQSEEVFQHWLAELREGGVVTPIGVLVCGAWLAGFWMAHWRRPLRRMELLATLLWIAGALWASTRSGDRPMTSG